VTLWSSWASVAGVTLTEGGHLSIIVCSPNYMAVLGANPGVPSFSLVFKQRIETMPLLND
jgi:hypothetical protein